MFHTERSWHTYRFTVVIVSGRQDLPSDARALILWLLWSVKLFITAEEGFQFSPSAFWIRITKRFSLVRECNVFLQCCITLGLACSRLRDGGWKSFSNKKCEKRAGAGERPPPPLPSLARLTFALLVLIRSHYTIWELGTGYAGPSSLVLFGEC